MKFWAILVLVALALVVGGGAKHKQKRSDSRHDDDDKRKDFEKMFKPRDEKEDKKENKREHESQAKCSPSEERAEKAPKASKELEWSVKRCPAGWYRYRDDKCFKFFAEQVSHSDAELACRAVGSTLASLSTDHERIFLRSLVLKESGDDLDKLWIGLRQKAGELYNFDLSLVPSSLAYVAGHPEKGTGDCAALACDLDTVTNVRRSDDFAKIAFLDCAEANTFACQKTIVDGNRPTACPAEPTSGPRKLGASKL